MRANGHPTPTASRDPRLIDEVIARVRRVEIRARRRVANVFLGEYRSVFRGRGIEFAEVRQYEPGDDVRSIDWNVTARMRTPYVKTYIEERELNVLLAVDVSASSSFTSTGLSKRDLAAEVVATLAFAAIANGDRVGLLTFSDRIEEFIPPAKDRRHVLRMLRELLYTQPKGARTSISGALRYIARVARRRSIVFLLSDFFDEGYETQLRAAAVRHEIIAITLNDRRDGELPDVGLLAVEDRESGERALLDTSDTRVRREYAERGRRMRERRRRMLASAGVDEVALHTDASYVAPLLQFFRQRERLG